MSTASEFSTLLTQFVQRDGRHVRQLAQAAAKQFTQVVSHATISRWLGNKVRPHHWDSLVKIATVLRLTRPEVNALLLAAHQPDLATLRRTHDDDKAQALWRTWHRPSPFQAPPRLPTFVGRETSLEIAQRTLRLVGSHRFVCLQGPGGTGKTSLALQLAYEMRFSFPDGVLWADLAHADSMDALQSFAATFQVDVTPYTDLSAVARCTSCWPTNKRCSFWTMCAKTARCGRCCPRRAPAPSS